MFEQARLLVDDREAQRLHLGWSRGGAFRLYDDESLLLADTGPTLQLEDGKAAVTHLEAENQVRIGDDEIVIEGTMAFAKSTRLTPAASILLRGFMISFGRFFPDLVRRLLQRLLVTGRKEAPFRFRRTLEWRDGGWSIRDEIIPEHGWSDVRQIGIGGFQSSLTTIMSRFWQTDQLQPWLDLTPKLVELQGNAPLIVERRPGAQR